MANKDIILKKRLIRDGIILTVILAAFGAGAYFLSNFNDEAEAEKQGKVSALGTARGELNSIDTQLKSGVEVNSSYAAYIQSHNRDFNIKRDAATQLMASLRERFYLSKLDLTISHLTDVPTDLIELKSGTLVKSEVKVTFTALTDNSIFGFIEALHREMPGMVVISELKLTRTADISRSIVMDLSQHKVTPMVSGDLSFIWLGIRPKAEEKPSGNGPGNGK